MLGFDVDPLDYDDPGADAVVQRTLATVAAGSIVSLHFGHSGTVDAMPAILDGLAQKGLTPVHRVGTPRLISQSWTPTTTRTAGRSARRAR